jgi:hypothetical protein
MATRNANNLPKDYLQKLFTYDEIEGHLIWNISRSTGRKTKGKRFGYDEKGGRRKGMIDKKNYRESNLIWMYHYGDIPNGMQVDHSDRNPSNNKLYNLRLATPFDNAGNRDKRYNSPNEYKGVSKSGKSTWRMQCAGKYYGVFKTKEEAAMKYNKVAIERWGEFANLNIIK